MSKGEGPHPAVAFVHGSGPAPRSSFMAQPEIRGEGLAETFARAGTAALVYGKRGFGESMGDRLGRAGHLLVTLTAVLFFPFMLYWNLAYPGLV